MLTLKNIKKSYVVGEQSIEALKGVDLSFRDNEFVSILGPSGCGKTTLLNIIGGLDRYTEGEMSINCVPTQSYNDADWDSYRNHSVGFVFQNYNLIPHQTVLANVELALTLSGVSKAERRRRAIEVLERVGLGDQLNKKPNQMSGGQMQRVAIARALVNDPDILLADEPTGALDSTTSVQVMELMREISKDRLVIMVTHNPELAQEYSTRIIRLLDGRVTDDTDPFNPQLTLVKQDKRRRTGMGFSTALSLSLNNLMTKKARTILTAFAGSIGIIGIALILSLSNGISNYITRVEEDTLSSYPLSIQHQSMDMSAMLTAMMGVSEEIENREPDKVYSFGIMNDMFNSLLSQVNTNDTAALKDFIESNDSGVPELVSDIKYSYNTDMYIYAKDENGAYVQANPNNIFESMGMGSEMSTAYNAMGSMNVFTELMGNDELLDSQYDVIAGRMPEKYDEVVIIVDQFNAINDMAIYALGLKDRNELTEMLTLAMSGSEMPAETLEFSYDDILDMSFRMVLNSDFFAKQDGVWKDMRGDSTYMNSIIENGVELKVVGIIRPDEEAVNTAMTGAVGYSSELTRYLLDGISNSEIVREQVENPEVDVFTGLNFNSSENNAAETAAPQLNQAQLEYYMSLTDEEKAAMAAMSAQTTEVTSTSTYESNMTLLGVSDPETPFVINIYPRDFEAKEKLNAILEEYNQRMMDEGKEESVIQYTDYVEIIMSSVNTIINAISYVLIAFVAISLIVSSIMIGIITYISVLERTKEIGILRAMGASKRDIARVFNAETLIVGFVSGAMGILISALLTIPINILIKYLADISDVAQLPAAGAVILVIISMFLTWIAGLIPSKIASKKDPVVALRTE